jgi:hypothetical protein
MLGASIARRLRAERPLPRGCPKAWRTLALTGHNRPMEEELRLQIALLRREVADMRRTVERLAVLLEAGAQLLRVNVVEPPRPPPPPDVTSGGL